MAELESVYVLDEFRGRGIGRKLMDNFFVWCQEKDVERVKIEASSKNSDGIRFYKRHGFNDYDLILEKEL